MKLLNFLFTSTFFLPFIYKPQRSKLQKEHNAIIIDLIDYFGDIFFLKVLIFFLNRCRHHMMRKGERQVSSFIYEMK